MGRVFPAAAVARHRADLVALLAYGAATLVFFWRVIVLGMVPVGYDLLAYFYPYKAYLASLVARGELPLWNPLIYMGAPLLANLQAAVFYPLDAIFYILPTTDALRWSVVLHVFLASAFTYLFARVSLQVSPPAAWVAGAVFGLGGFVGARAGHLNQLHAAVWLPLLLLVLERAAATGRRGDAKTGGRGDTGTRGCGDAERSPHPNPLPRGEGTGPLPLPGGEVRGEGRTSTPDSRLSTLDSRPSVLSPQSWVCIGALAFAVQILAGHTQEVYYSGWALALFASYLSFFSGLRGMQRARPWLALLAIAVGGTLLSSVQLLPTLELAQQSYRFGGIPWAEAVAYSVHRTEILDSILPLYQRAPYVEVTGYTGVVSLALLPAALAVPRRSPHHWFFGAMALLALLLSLGDSTPFYGWMYRLVPGFDLFRAPGRWLFLYDLSVALLAALGLDGLRTARSNTDLRRFLSSYAWVLASLLGALVLYRFWLGSQDLELALPHPRVVLNWALFGSLGLAISIAACTGLHSRLATGLLLVLLLLDLYLAGEALEYRRPADPSLYTSSRPLHATLSEAAPYRMLSLAGEQYELEDQAELLSSLPRPMDRSEAESYLQYTRLKEILAPNVGMAFGLASLDGYDGGLLPTRRYAELKAALLKSKEYRPDATMRVEATGVPDSRRLGALGVRYLLTNGEPGGHDPGWQEAISSSGDSLRLLSNADVLPRAHVVHRAWAAASDREALEAIERLDLSEVAVLPEEVPFTPPIEDGGDQATLLKDEPTEVLIEASLAHPGFLVLSDSYYPGWRVYVDGHEARLLRANYAVRAVQLESGRHQVRFLYDPASFRIGLTLSLLALLLWAGLLWKSLRSRRPKAS